MINLLAKAIAIAFFASIAFCACMAGWRLSLPTGTTAGCALASVRVGTSHVVDSRGDVWLVHGFDSDARGLLVDGRCANESGVCSGRTAKLVPLADVVEVRP